MNINLYTWFADRKLDFLPKHFVCTNTYIDDERHQWVLEKCIGRYYIGQHFGDEDFVTSLFSTPIIYFEDPQEAVLYKLTWS